MSLKAVIKVEKGDLCDPKLIIVKYLNKIVNIETRFQTILSGVVTGMLSLLFILLLHVVGNTTFFLAVFIMKVWRTFCLGH